MSVCRRYWVLEGTDGESEDDDGDDAASIATEDFEEQQLQETQGPVSPPFIVKMIFDDPKVVIYHF